MRVETYLSCDLFFFLILAFGRSITKSDNQNKSFLVMIKHQGTSGERKPLDLPTI